MPSWARPMWEQYYPSSMAVSSHHDTHSPPFCPLLLSSHSIKKHVNVPYKRTTIPEQSVFLSKTKATMEHVKRASTPPKLHTNAHCFIMTHISTAAAAACCAAVVHVNTNIDYMQHAGPTSLSVVAGSSREESLALQQSPAPPSHLLCEGHHVYICLLLKKYKQQQQNLVPPLPLPSSIESLGGFPSQFFSARVPTLTFVQHACSLHL